MTDAHLDGTVPLGGRAAEGAGATEADVPDTIGPYTLRSLLGSGGYGAVFLADDHRTGQAVALKLVKVSSRDRREGIRREVHALGRLDHPGIVRILDHGVHGGMPWYAMPHLAGRTLLSYREELLSARGTHTPAAEDAPTELLGARAASGAALSQEAAVRPAGAEAGALLTVVRRLCSALAYMHGEGLVHRDLKPANVIVREGGIPVIVDFGLAVSSGTRDALDDSVASGTPAYMAPEQARGEAVDPRADLYALGCILFELLSGELPFSGAAALQVAFRHRRLEAPRLSSIVPDVAPELDLLVARLLAPEPAARIGYAEDVARALAELGVANGMHGPHPPRPYLYRPGFAGRRDALERARAWIDDLLGTGAAGRLVLVSGESGIGKTRFLNEVASLAALEGVQVVASEIPRHPAPLQGLRPALELLADRAADGGPREQAALFPRGAARLAAFEPALAAVVPADPGSASLEHVLLDLEDALAALAAGRPLLVIVDDLQWADSLTLAALARIRPPRTLLCGAYRIEEGLARPLAESDALELHALAATSVEEIARDMLGGTAAPGALLAAISALCGGNPLLAGEYLRELVHAGGLVRDERGAWGRRPVATDGLPGAPGDLHEVLELRLALLSDGARRIAALAAAIGREPGSAVLAAAGESLGMDVVAGAAELVARHVLEETPDARLRFAHDRLRESAYARLAEEARAATHAAIAAAIEAHRDDVEDADAALARHWELAGEPARAATHHAAAALKARAQFATDEAIAHDEAFLRLEPGPGPASAAARTRLGALLHQSGRRDEGLAMLEAAALEARDCGAGLVEAAAHRAMGWARRERMEPDEARRAYEQAIALFDQEDAAVESAAALGDLATVVQNRGELVEAVGMYERAVARLEELGEEARAARTRLSLASAYSQLGAVDKAGGMYEEAVARYRGTDPRALAVALGGLAIVRHRQERRDEALGMLEEALALYEKVRDVRGQMITWSWKGNVAAETGEHARARTAYERCLSLARGVGARWEEAGALVNLGGSLGELGLRGEAVATLREALVAGRAAGRRDVVQAAEQRLALLGDS